MTNQNIPKLRFKRFEGWWKENKLGQISKFWNGKAHEQDVTDSGKYIIVNSKFVSTNGKVKKFSNKQISPLRKDDITIVMSDIPNGKAIGKCFLINTDDKYTLNQRIGGLNSSKVISNFLIRILNRNKYFLRFDNGVSQTNLRKEEVLNCPIKYPGIEEQERIASFLDKVDEWIGNLKQQKENLEKYKKGMMKKIFAQKIRFKDENRKEFEEWKEEKLGDVSKFWNGKAHEQDVLENGKYIIVNSKFISSDGTVRKFTSRQISPLHKDDIAMVMSDIPNGKAIGKCFLIDEENKYTLNQRIGGIKSSKIISRFLIRTINRNKYFLKFDNGVSQTNLRKEEILRCPIKFPELEEQQKIADFLTSIDKLIDSKQEQIAKAEEWKKGLMQGLFV